MKGKKDNESTFLNIKILNNLEKIPWAFNISRDDRILIMSRKGDFGISIILRLIHYFLYKVFFGVTSQD